MEEAKKISKKLLMRLPVYLEYIKALPDYVAHISSPQLADALGLGEVLVRKDLAKVSSGGRRRIGYAREILIRDIEAFLNANSVTHAVIVGTGKLGQALLDYSGFEECGMDILAGFDICPPRKRSSLGKPIHSDDKLSEFCRDHDVRIGVITVPKDQAQSVCDQLISCGIRAIWNFTPAHLCVPDYVVVQSANLSISLAALHGQLKEQENMAG